MRHAPQMPTLAHAARWPRGEREGTTEQPQCYQCYYYPRFPEPQVSAAPGVGRARAIIQRELRPLHAARAARARVPLLPKLLFSPISPCHPRTAPGVPPLCFTAPQSPACRQSSSWPFQAWPRAPVASGRSGVSTVLGGVRCGQCVHEFWVWVRVWRGLGFRRGSVMRRSAAEAVWAVLWARVCWGVCGGGGEESRGGARGWRVGAAFNHHPDQ